MKLVILSLLLTIAGAVGFADAIGYDRGKREANLTMWENPPGMAYCVVYQDGGKKCVQNMELPPISLSECIRQCRARTKMEKVK